MKRGEVYWAHLTPRSGSEQSGRRPVVIVSHDGFNQVRGWRSVIIVPLSTSPSQRQRGPTAVALPKGAAGLSKDGIALCHQVTTLDRTKLSRHIGTLPTDVMDTIDAGLKAALSLW